MRLGVVILAAGLGKRMRSSLPKVLHPLAGRPLLSHVLHTAHALDPECIVTVYGHGGDLVRAALPDAPCRWVEQAQQLGTGHAVMQAMPLVKDLDRVLVLYGDVPLTSIDTLERLLGAGATSALAILTARVSDPTGYGRILRDDHQRVIGIVEEKDATTEERAIREINTGILVADRARLDQWLAGIGNANSQGEYYLTDVTAQAAAEGVAIATIEPGRLVEVTGVNDRVQLAALEREYQRHAAETLMRDGVTLADPARFDLRGVLHADLDVEIDINCIIEGDVRLGRGVRIGPHCLLKDCEIGPETRVGAHSVIEGAQVGADARIGPFARLRPESVLGDQSHVGNFVEIKKTRLGPGSKANHLTYLGDSDIGAGVNIGAGTITCNYDGANKSKTLIGDRAFIGSNTALVAPVEVGADATIGAGSVLTRNAPPDQLTVSRARQVSVPGWQRPKKRPND